MKEEIFLVGMNHRTAPVEIRERISKKVTENSFFEFVNQKNKENIIKEHAVISTCNRIEFITVTSDCEFVSSLFTDFATKETEKEISSMLYEFKSQEAVRHLFRVAVGLDSMVVGEPQILGQIKDAYRKALQIKTVGVILNRLFHKTFSVAKKVRTETGIGCHAVSVSYAAVELAKKIFGNIREKKVLLIGAGEMAELAAEHFIRSGVSKIYIANRTLEKALELARQFKAETVPFENFTDTMKDVDIVLSSTGAPGFILYKDDIKACMKKRKNKPLFIIDIAVPRDVDPEVHTLDNVFLYDIDDLKGVVEWNKAERRKEAEKAEHIIKEETLKFQQWLHTLDVAPTIIAMRYKAEQIRKVELEKTLSKLANLSEKEIEAIYALTEAIIKKMLHDPIDFIKKKALRPSKEFYLDIIQQIFNLPIGDRDLMSSKQKKT